MWSNEKLIDLTVSVPRQRIVINWKWAERLSSTYGGGQRDVSDPWELRRFKLTPLQKTRVVVTNRRSVQLERQQT